MSEGDNEHSGGPEFAIDQGRLQQLNRGETVVIDTSEAVNISFDRVWLQPRNLTEHETNALSDTDKDQEEDQ